MNHFYMVKIRLLSNSLYENGIWAVMTRWSSSLPVFILSGCCYFMSFYEPFSFYFAYIYFFLWTSKDVSLLSYHLKHQLSTCTSIGLFSGTAFPHIFYLCVIACLLPDFPCVSLYILCHTLSVGFLYDFILFYIPTLWFYNPDCAQSEFFIVSGISHIKHGF